MSDVAIQLGLSGFVLFTIGLFVGFVIPAMRNPRMGLSAHLTAAQTGPALIAMALFWEFFSVPEGWTAPLLYALIASSYLLVLGIMFAAIFGASRALPIAGKGYQAGRGKELFVSLMVKGSSVVMALTSMIICYFALAHAAKTNWP